MPRHSLALAWLLFAALSGCASSGGAPKAASGNTITAAELTQLAPMTAYDAVARLRPQWLNYRGKTSVRNSAPENQPVVAGNTYEGIYVYVDGTRRGEISTLRSIELQEVREIRFLPARDAATRFGTGHPAGVIEVVTRG